MKIVAIIPIKLKSERVKGKNFKIVNKKPLYRHLLDKLKKTNFDKIYVDSDSMEIKRYCEKKKFIFIKRKPKLSHNNANGNDLINYHSKIIDADIYFQLFVTAPLISIKTINNCIKILKVNKNYDSILTAQSIYSWFWFKKKPVNYKPKLLPRSQDANPVILETTALYGIRKRALKKFKCRIGKKPFFYETPRDESVDLDTEEDFKTLQFFLSKRKK